MNESRACEWGKESFPAPSLEFCVQELLRRVEGKIRSKTSLPGLSGKYCGPVQLKAVEPEECKFW